MRTVTIDQAINDLISVINYSLKTREEITISTNDGSVIILPQEDYEAMQETLSLLMDKKSLHAVLKGHSYREDGKTPKSYSVKEVLNDIKINILENASCPGVSTFAGHSRPGARPAQLHRCRHLAGGRYLPRDNL